MPGAYVRVEHVNRVASGAMECRCQVHVVGFLYLVRKS